MKTDLIKAIFTNVLFVIGVILLIAGFANGTSTAVKTIVFDQYPLNSYDETRCDMENWYPVEPAVAPAAPATDSGSEVDPQTKAKEEMEKRTEKCLASLERQRDMKQVEDTVSSVTLFISGLALVVIFKGFIFGGKKN